MKDIGIQEAQIQPQRKIDMESYYTEVKRVSGLHDVLSRHHRPDGERVGDISQVGGGEGRLG